MTPSEHDRWNAGNYPGTRQLCVLCEQPAGRCEEDSIYLDAPQDGSSCVGPLCLDCYYKLDTESGLY